MLLLQHVTCFLLYLIENMIIFLSETLTRSEERTALFLDQLQTIYPEQFGNITPPYIDDAYNLILRSKMSWKDSDGKAILCTLSSNQNNISFRVIVNSSVVVTNSSDYADSYAVNRSNKLVSRQYSTNSINFTDFISGNSANNDEPVLKVFGFLFHKISLTICIILVVWVSNDALLPFFIDRVSTAGKEG